MHKNSPVSPDPLSSCRVPKVTPSKNPRSATVTAPLCSGKTRRPFNGRTSCCSRRSVGADDRVTAPLTPTAFLATSWPHVHYHVVWLERRLTQDGGVVCARVHGELVVGAFPADHVVLASAEQLPESVLELFLQISKVCWSVTLKRKTKGTLCCFFLTAWCHAAKSA